MTTKKIVIVDDFSGVRSIVKESLIRRGYEVHDCDSGADALKFFNGTQIDLLITDYDMPDMNGAELVQRIRNMSRYMFTPVIMLSGIKKERVEEKLADLNIAAYIQKPFEIKHFYTVIERLAGRVDR